MKTLNALGAALILTIAGPALAEGERIALVIGNSDYAHAPVADTAVRDIRAVAEALEAAGWDVTSGEDLDRYAMRRVITRFAEQAPEAEEIVVYYSGHALRTGGVTYLAATDAFADTLTDVYFDGVPLEVLLRTAGEAPGGAVVFLDGAQLRGFTPTDFVEPGLADLSAPEGVVIVSAAPPGEAIARSAWRDSRFARLITGEFVQPGVPVMEAAADAEAPTFIVGETAADFMLMAPPGSVEADNDELAREIELAYWRTAERSGDAADYRDYLDRYPDGLFAEFARDRLGIAAGSADPAEPEVPAHIQAERDLNLSRIRKRQVQEWLFALGHDPNGIDGLFGPGSRAAITAWQRKSGFDPANGWLDEAQLARLRAEGEAAVAEQKRIAEEQRRVAEAEDNGYWAATGARGRPDDFRAYLEKYPQGLHAAEARAALDKVAEAEADDAARREKRMFERVKQRDTPEAYRRYLGEYPQGIYTQEALARLDEIESAEKAAQDKARFEAAEAALNLTQEDRISVEQRLRLLGFAAGPIDGDLDPRTRGAIEGFQAERGLTESGYLDRPTVVTLVRETDDRQQGQVTIDGARVMQELLRAISGQQN